MPLGQYHDSQSQIPMYQGRDSLALVLLYKNSSWAWDASVPLSMPPAQARKRSSTVLHRWLFLMAVRMTPKAKANMPSCTTQGPFLWRNSCYDTIAAWRQLRPNGWSSTFGSGVLERKCVLEVLGPILCCWRCGSVRCAESAMEAMSLRCIVGLVTSALFHLETVLFLGSNIILMDCRSSRAP